jgi:hypothetical protein
MKRVFGSFLRIYQETAPFRTQRHWLYLSCTASSAGLAVPLAALLAAPGYFPFAFLQIWMGLLIGPFIHYVIYSGSNNANPAISGAACLPFLMAHLIRPGIITSVLTFLGFIAWYYLAAAVIIGAAP